MMRISFLLFTIILLISCSETTGDGKPNDYKNDFLKVVEFNCEGITSDHYIEAVIDNQEYCTNTNIDVKNQIHIVNNFTTSSPSTDSSGIISGSAYKSIWFGLFEDFSEIRIEHLYFESMAYPVSKNLNDIAADVFVEDKRWSVAGEDSDEESISVIYQYLDYRKGYNTFHLVNSLYGPQNDKYIYFNKVNITKDEEFIYYEVEMTFEADLYMEDRIEEHTNLWAELREGKLVAEFKVKK